MKVNAIVRSIGLGLFLLLQQCTPQSISLSPSTGDWNIRAELEGPARSAAVSFTIGNIAYIGTGLDVSNNSLADFWKYDPSRNAWTQVADFPGKARSEAVAFATRSKKGYLGTGMDAQGNLLRDFYEYDPTTNAWKRIADFSGSARRSATAFSMYDLGFVALGFDGSERADLWRYNSSANQWTERKYIGGPARVGAAAFVINNLAYVGAGSSQNVNLSDFWMYDPDNNIWTQRRNIPDAISASSGAVGFSIDNTGYFVTGSGGRQVLVYNSVTDFWTEQRPFEGSSRSKAVGFAIGQKGYITTGSNGNTRFDDLWEFDPTY
ncbi:galactose oxidase [Spirosoma sp. HMF4905]|uniref:Galactose oxidase n=1 Tax=Spirosoma arboris TaxID=2682092 RepID=A0A7K1SLP2_9BACT|nr:kelch repeat-containing protein [Spirosoma arboris]MVM34694.1 galactose oxidase [Spirosoma arboris]